MNSPIFFRETKDRQGFTNQILKKFKNEFESKTVLVKPNIVSHEPYPTTTHPDLLRTVIAYLKNLNCTILVGDGPAIDAGKSETIIKSHPLSSICSEFEIDLLNLHKIGFSKTKTSSLALRISKIVSECDYIISLPVLKAHKICGLTGALKNQFGLFQTKERIFLHIGLKNIHKAIAEINRTVKPDLFIIDAIETYSITNEKRHGGIKTELGYMLAGKDPVALDCFGLELLQSIDTNLANKNPNDILHIKHAFEFGVGQIKFEKSELQI